MKFVFCQNNLIFLFSRFLVSTFWISLAFLNTVKFCFVFSHFVFFFGHSQWLAIIQYFESSPRCGSSKYSRVRLQVWVPAGLGTRVSGYPRVRVPAGPQNTRGVRLRAGLGGRAIWSARSPREALILLCFVFLFVTFFLIASYTLVVQGVAFVSLFLVFTASIGKSFGSGEQCQNWRESPKASGSTNLYDDVTWWAFL